MPRTTSHDRLPVIGCVAMRDEVRGRLLREDEKELVDAPDCSRG